MEGPTPVSALMHAATLVTAGCVLLIKFNFIIQPYLYILLIGSLLTAIYCSLRAAIEFDFKKIVALSTAAQMSIVFLIVAFGKPKLAIMYLIIHAMFKSLLFWSVGLNNHQDWTQNLIAYCRSNRHILFNILITVVVLAGLPLFSAYFLKEFLLCLTSDQLLYIILHISLVFIIEMQSTVYAFRILKHLMNTLKYQKISLNFDILTYVPLILYSCSTVLIGRFLNIKLYNNSLILVTQSANCVHVINIIFIFLIILLQLLASVIMTQTIPTVCTVVKKSLQFLLYQLIALLKVIKTLQLIYIKKLQNYLFNL